MPSYFPCPNTQCGYQFDADILPPAALVTCPLCRTKFPYRANRPLPTAAGADAPGAAGPAPPAGPRVVNLRDVPRDGGPLSVILWIGGTVAVLGTLTAVLYVWSNKPSGIVSRGDENGEQSDPKFNLKLDPFPPEYAEDVAAREGIQANIFARKRAGPDGWTAMAAKDFKDRNPRPAELDDLVRGRLKAALGTPDVVPAAGENTWAGKPARAVAFSGDWDGNPVKGQAFAIAHQGFAYAFFAWAAERDWDGLRGELTGLREKFHFLSTRADWEAKTPGTRVFDGTGYRLEDSDDVWARGKPAADWKPKEEPRFVLDDPKEHDPAADMMLLAAFQSRAGGDGKRHRAEALAMVAILTTAGNPLEVAKAHVTERIQKEFAGQTVDVKLEPLATSPAGVALPAGGPAIGRFRFQNPLERDDRSLWIIAAIPVGGKVVAVEVRAKEKEATYVEEWMVHLAGSLKAQ